MSLDILKPLIKVFVKNSPHKKHVFFSPPAFSLQVVHDLAVPDFSCFGVLQNYLSSPNATIGDTLFKQLGPDSLRGCTT